MNSNNDHILHAPNLSQLLIQRGYLQSQEQLIKLMDTKHKERVQYFEFQVEQSDQYSADVKTAIDEQQLNKLDFGLYKKAIVVYVFSDHRIQNLDILKKYLASANLVIIVCDDQQLRSARTKSEKLLSEDFAGQRKRIELIHHDLLLVNLIKNNHFSVYNITPGKQLRFLTNTLKIKPQHLPKIQANDPLLMYYGIPDHVVVTQTGCSQTTAGEKVDYLYVIPPVQDSIYLSYIIQ